MEMIDVGKEFILIDGDVEGTGEIITSFSRPHFSPSIGERIDLRVDGEGFEMTTFYVEERMYHIEQSRRYEATVTVELYLTRDSLE